MSKANKSPKVRSGVGTKKSVLGHSYQEHRANPNGRITSGKPTGNPPKK